jgi:F-type H+-transporting ATPase subunit b
MLLYLVNFGILFGLLGWLVVPKLTKLLDQRRETIEGDLATSAKLKAELAQTLAESEAQAKQLKADLTADRAELAKDFKAQKEAMLVAMQAERNQTLTEARKQIAEEKKRLVAEVKSEIVSVMQVGVKSFLAKADEKSVSESLEDAWKAVNK